MSGPAFRSAFGLGSLWFVPMVRMSGGLPLYLEIVRRHAANNAAVTFTGGGWNALAANVVWALVYTVNGLMLAAVVLLATLWYRVRRMPAEQRLAWRNKYGRAMSVLACWIVPMVLFGSYRAKIARRSYL